MDTDIFRIYKLLTLLYVVSVECIHKLNEKAMIMGI